MKSNGEKREKKKKKSIIHTYYDDQNNNGTFTFAVQRYVRQLGKVKVRACQRSILHKHISMPV